ncbi:general secretion pathway protein GspB [Marinobacter sp.]|uniref:general secretion pathway protein GspB n=1 Tax=Marinobacter sp. TaxID=50741 RepID=UPI0019F19D85|nr:general secretion pathway protein GspB [Marinobacter sp.]MBE0487127.1 general secretion pathway protein GspB [Marinobacter sp.]
MSYILDALRRSEAERRQGKAPDLGQQVQMVYRPKKKPVSPLVWVVVALLVNAGVMAYLFWPPSLAEPDAADVAQRETPEPVIERPPVITVPEVAEPAPAPAEEPQADDEQMNEPVAVIRNEAPLVIVPDQSVRERVLTSADSQGRVPHLVELPLAFQKSVPDLTFNSHIYSSDPEASRVMINNHYLRPGDAFGNLTVERVTEDGVVLSQGSQHFRVGTVRDWVSPR